MQLSQIDKKGDTAFCDKSPDLLHHLNLFVMKRSTECQFSCRGMGTRSREGVNIKAIHL